ncbi:MAG: zinc transporter ZupT [Chloroflexota bacterium]|nr:zinc transporter ZupT [Chloroflexota bacterium]
MLSAMGFALLLSALAGLATTVGSFMAFIIREPGPRVMSFTLGFSGGVMLLVSFVELLASGIDAIGFAAANLAFFGGMLAMFLLDVLIPHDFLAEKHAPEIDRRDEMVGLETQLLKTGLFVALGLGIHNFPEGMATFATALSDPNVGIAIAIAIAVHNIPEGLAVSAPIYAATGSRRKAFWWSFLSGVAEPVGAAMAALFLLPFLNEAVLGILLAAVAGIMVFISLDELLPVARAYGEEHLSILGIVTGMAVMSFSLWLLR